MHLDNNRYVDKNEGGGEKKKEGQKTYAGNGHTVMIPTINHLGHLKS